MPFLVDNVGEVLEIHNRPEDIKILKSDVDDNTNSGLPRISLTEKGERFYRLVTSQQIKKGFIHPTTDNGHYHRTFLDGSSNFFGYFTGDKDDWLAILLRDGFLDANYPIYEVEIEFPEGTPYIVGDRPVSMNYMDSFITELFIVYDQPVKIIAKTLISDDELNDAENWIEESSEDPFEDDIDGDEFEED